MFGYINFNSIDTLEGDIPGGYAPRKKSPTAANRTKNMINISFLSVSSDHPDFQGARIPIALSLLMKGKSPDERCYIIGQLFDAPCVYVCWFAKNSIR